MSVIEKAIQWAVSIAADNTHGYDQIHRWGPDYDCSSLVISAYRAAGLPLKGATYTGNMRAAFIKDGFKSIPYKKGMSLFRGDVLLNEKHHTALYIGDGKIVEASHGDDNKKHSESWNSSIRVTTLTDSRYNSFKRVHRFNGSVNTTAYIGFGEVSDRVALLQSFLKWYGFDIASDRYFGEATVKAVQEFQAENGLEVDGKVGEKTLKKMSEVRK